MATSAKRACRRDDATTDHGDAIRGVFDLFMRTPAKEASKAVFYPKGLKVAVTDPNDDSTSIAWVAPSDLDAWTVDDYDTPPTDRSESSVKFAAMLQRLAPALVEVQPDTRAQLLPDDDDNDDDDGAGATAAPEFQAHQPVMDDDDDVLTGADVFTFDGLTTERTERAYQALAEALATYSGVAWLLRVLAVRCSKGLRSDQTQQRLKRWKAFVKHANLHLTAPIIMGQRLLDLVLSVLTDDAEGQTVVRAMLYFQHHPDYRVGDYDCHDLTLHRNSCQAFHWVLPDMREAILMRMGLHQSATIDKTQCRDIAAFVEYTQRRAYCSVEPRLMGYTDVLRFTIDAPPKDE